MLWLKTQDDALIEAGFHQASGLSSSLFAGHLQTTSCTARAAKRQGMRLNPKASGAWPPPQHFWAAYCVVTQNVIAASDC